MNKNILIYGMGVSGISTLRALKDKNLKISVLDSKSESELKNLLIEFADQDISYYLGGECPDLSNIDLIIKSPGIPMDTDILKEATSKNIDVITDIELAYALRNTENLITVTGTNGKTSTSVLIDKILQTSGKETYLVGNIGVGILDLMIRSNSKDYFVIEASSFQLNNIIDFRPKVSVLINLSPDHIDWHGDYENYINSKFNIFKNQKCEDYAILNFDDIEIRKRSDKIKSKIIWFSSKQILNDGIYIDKNNIYYTNMGKKVKIMSTSNINLILENVLAAIGVSISLGIDCQSIKEAVLEFKPLEHRMEKFLSYNNILFINDSKGTNPNSTKEALKSINNPIILIAGGFDKGADFDDLSSVFKNKIKKLILLGATKEKIAKSALNNGFNVSDIDFVQDMSEAVNMSLKYAEADDIVLLSPACASWGDYKNFQERGKEFKNLVKTRVGEINGKKH